ncbi:unnamed protein product, partial [Amoebophrya sp. A120]
ISRACQKNASKLSAGSFRPCRPSCLVVCASQPLFLASLPRLLQCSSARTGRRKNLPKERRPGHVLWLPTAQKPAAAARCARAFYFIPEQGQEGQCPGGLICNLACKIHYKFTTSHANGC